MKHPKHDVLNAAYLFYYATDVIFRPGGSEGEGNKGLGERLNLLIGDLLVVAHNVGFFLFADRTTGQAEWKRPAPHSLAHVYQLRTLWRN